MTETGPSVSNRVPSPGPESTTPRACIRSRVLRSISVPAGFDAPLDSKDHAEEEGGIKGDVDSEADSGDDGLDNDEAGSEADGKAEGDPFGKVQGRAESRCEGKPEDDSNPGAQGEPDRELETWQKRAPEGHSNCGRKAEAENLDNSPHGDAHTGYRALTRTNPHFLKIPSRIPPTKPNIHVKTVPGRGTGSAFERPGT